ncbi:MAG: hypothetical protein WCS77_01855 [Elusimicrobiaceae bacterium]
MVKKLIAVAGLAVLLPASSFAYWGLGVKGGATAVTDDDFKNEMSYSADSAWTNYSGEVSKNGGYAGAELFLEGNGENRFGVSVGIKSIAETKLTEDWGNGATTLEAKNSAIAFPVTLYWKHKAEDSSVGFWLGAGADFMKAKTKWSDSYGVNTDFKQNKLVPHVDAGLEWYIFKRVSLGVNLGYLFGGKFDELKGSVNGTDMQLYTTPQSVGSSLGYAASKPAGSNNFSQDYSGVRGELALRVYFGGPDSKE